MARLARFTPARTCAALVAAAAAAASLAGVVSPASADSLSQVRHDIAAAQHRLDALDAQAEAATERYNAARIALGQAQQKVATTGQRLAQAQARLDALRRSVTAFAVAAYQGEAIDSSIGITADSPQAFLDKLATLQAVSDSQAQALASLAAAGRDQEQARADADAALSQQKADTATVTAERNAVLRSAHEEQTILQGLQVREVALVRAAKARAARIAAERAAAALRAREAAAAAAARALAAQASEAAVSSYSPVAHVSGSGGASTAVQWAYRELGKPYVWGASGPDSFDCSGLTMYVWGKAGVALDHYTGSQWNEGTHVSQSQLQPGDLVFFGSDLHHVGIYIGNGNMIEAPHTGANVRISSYNRPDYAGAVRP